MAEVSVLRKRFQSNNGVLLYILFHPALKWDERLGQMPLLRLTPFVPGTSPELNGPWGKTRCALWRQYCPLTWQGSPQALVACHHRALSRTGETNWDRVNKCEPPSFTAVWHDSSHKMCVCASSDSVTFCDSYKWTGERVSLAGILMSPHCSLDNDSTVCWLSLSGILV